jgi:hypothetical protein
MQRYYTTRGTYKHGRVADRAKEVFAIYWDHKKKKHNFISLTTIKEATKKDGYFRWTDFGTPVVFENEEQEKEFLTYHPDAACLRTEYRHGYFYPCRAWGVDEEKLPFEYRRGRWCWKKPLTVA